MGSFNQGGRSLTIEKQKEYLFNRFQLEKLRSSEANLESINDFEQASDGNAIAYFLKHEAWDEDEERNTKVYLVKDKVTQEIVYFFSINCGILYSEIEELQLSDEEKEPFERYVKAYHDNKNATTKSQREKADNELSDAMSALNDVVADPERASILFSYAEDKASKIEKFSDTTELEHTNAVKETFPAIDIKFLCRNKKYKPKITLDIKIGVFIFWEIIVPIIIEISENVGCKYIYLFAADQSEKNDIKEPVLYTPDYDPYADDEQEDGERVLRLVNYYQNELLFDYVAQYKILKPEYERMCYTLVQRVDTLQENRERVWLTHLQYSPDDKTEG